MPRHITDSSLAARALLLAVWQRLRRVGVAACSAMPRAPGPHARVLGGSAVTWRGAEGECVEDPVTPGVVWLGGARGGSRVEGITHLPAGTPNGGDVAAGRATMALRDTTLEAIQARPARVTAACARAVVRVWFRSRWRGRERAVRSAGVSARGQDLSEPRRAAALLRKPEDRARAAVPDQKHATARCAGGESQAEPQLARGCRRRRRRDLGCPFACRGGA